MTDDAPLAKKTESIPKYVQEIAISGQDPPERYCYRDGVFGGGLDASCLPLMEIPVIDIGLLASPSSDRQHELNKLHSALSLFGCFMSINHGMSSSFLDTVSSVSKQFFVLPMEEKLKFRGVDPRQGYGSDMILSDDQILDWNDRLLLEVSPEDRRLLKFWPENPITFRETIFEYTAKLKLINEVVLNAMAMSLNLKDHCFLDMCGVQAITRARFSFFPPCSRHHQVLGLRAHSDSSVISIVLQDKNVEGLQFLKDAQWYRAPIIPEALLINLGDQAEIMSNGLFKSPMHRVVINPERERCSVAVFYHSDPENYIEPVDGLVDAMRPRRYRKVKDYVGTFIRHYQHGKRLIDELKIKNF